MGNGKWEMGNGKWEIYYKKISTSILTKDKKVEAKPKHGAKQP